MKYFKNTRKTGAIQDMQRTTHSEPPPLAYDLTELQRDANKDITFQQKKHCLFYKNFTNNIKLSHILEQIHDI